MTILETLNHLIESFVGDLEGLSLEIREETDNPSDYNSLEWLQEQYDIQEQHLENLKQMKTILENNEIS